MNNKDEIKKLEKEITELEKEIERLKTTDNGYIREMALCEVNYIHLHPNVLYRFVVVPGCEKCQKENVYEKENKTEQRYWCCNAEFGKHELTCKNYTPENTDKGK